MSSKPSWRRRPPITGASAAEVAMVLVVMCLGLFVFDWTTGAVAATVAFIAGRLAGCAYLEVDRRKARFSPLRQQLFPRQAAWILE